MLFKCCGLLGTKYRYNIHELRIISNVAALTNTKNTNKLIVNSQNIHKTIAFRFVCMFISSKHAQRTRQMLMCVSSTVQSVMVFLLGAQNSFTDRRVVAARQKTHTQQIHCDKPFDGCEQFAKRTAGASLLWIC